MIQSGISKPGSSTRHGVSIDENWLRLLSARRLGRELKDGAASRTAYQRDFDRIVFSTAFRRLADKTQVFPLPDNDLVHSRLTHSLEVSCVGRSLGTMVGEKLIARHERLRDAGLSARDFGDIVAAACLAHDIGNPPFGHAGEDAIGSWFAERPDVTSSLSEHEKWDLEKFEGNAQGFRILTRLQMPANHGGLQLTCATLGAFTKYPRQSGPRVREAGVAGKKHGFFQTERALFEEVADETGVPSRGELAWGRHPLACLVEAADDICYAILDIEDGYRLGHVGYAEAFARLEPVAARDATYRRPRDDEPKEAIAYLRAKSINQLAQEVLASFLDAEETILGPGLMQPLSTVIGAGALLADVVAFTSERCYRAQEVVEIELAGYGVLQTLLSELVPAVLATSPTKKQAKLLDAIHRHPAEDLEAYPRLLLVTDYLSGMTDSYAVSFFKKLLGTSLV